MEIKQVVETKEVHYFVIGGAKIKQYELYEMLEALEGTDCMTRAVTLHHSKLKKVLEEADIIRTNIRGSSCPTKNFDEFYKQIEELIFKED